VPVNKNNKKLMPGCPIYAFCAEALPMATNDLIPLFLSDPIEVPEQAGNLQAWERAVIASRIITTGIWFVAAAAIGFAILSVGTPVVLFENVAASLFATSAPQDGTGQSMPIIQSTADTQPLPPTASEVPTGDEIAATLKTADQSQTDIRQPSPEALLNQFQAWAAEEDAQAQVKVRPVQPVQNAQAQVAQTAPEQVAQTAPEQVRPVRTQRQVRPAQNARAKVVKNARAQLHRARNRAQVQPVQNAQTQIRSVQNAQVQNRSAQDAQAPRLLQSLRN
jgi:hypothetical protein